MNKKKFITSYIKQKRTALVSIIIMACCFAMSFYFYHIPLQAIAYPSILVAFLLCCYFIYDCLKSYEQYKNIKTALKNIYEYPLENSDDLIIQMYQDAIYSLLQKMRSDNDDLLKQYSEMQEYFTTWAHQIKTPIASSKLQLESMDSNQSRILTTKMNQIEQYVDMALTFIKLDHNTDFIFKEVSLDQMIREVLRRYSLDFIMKKLSLQFKETHLNILTDEKWFCFILEQLLSNALKYTEKGGIDIYLQDQYLCIKDSGIGIAPQDLPRIFEKGYSGFNGRNQKKASGIGLYLVKKICDKLNMSITVQSSLNNGTVVKLGVIKDDMILE